MLRIIFLVTALALSTFIVRAETVYVKYRGPVDLDAFECKTITRSSFINRVCYSTQHKYMVILLRSTYYHYCEIGPDTVKALMEAPSMGRYYNANIKRGIYDCRLHGVPQLH